VAIICDKYDMRQSLEVWLEKWVPLLVDEADPQVKGHKWLLVSYAFARATLFEKLSKDLILSSAIDEDGGMLMTADDGTTSNTYISEAVVAEMMACRQQAVERILDRVHHYIEQYGQVGEDKLKCKCSTKDKLCDSVMLGCFSSAFREIGLYPTPEGANQSLKNLKKLIDSIEFPSRLILRIDIVQQTGPQCCSTCPIPTTTVPAADHASCSPLSKFKTEVSDIVNSITSLEYSRFVRNNKENKKRSIPPPVACNLWDYVEDDFRQG